MYTINLLLLTPTSTTILTNPLEKTPLYNTESQPNIMISYHKNGQEVEEITNLKELFYKNCYKIFNIFPEKLIKDIEKLSREMSRHFGNESSDMLVKMTNEPMEFSSSHEIANAGTTLIKFREKSPLLEKIITIFINRFAMEQQWIGTHTFDLQLFRYTPLSGQNTTQKWHYDTGSKK
jgi:hypothetical protein